MTSTPELLRQIVGAVDEKLNVVNYRWNPSTLAYEVETVGGGTGADVNVTNVPLAVTAAQLPAALTALGNLKVAVEESSGGGLTNTELRATPVPVDGSGVTQPVSAATLPLPTGAASAAKQDTGNASVASIDTKTPTPKTADFDTGVGTDTVAMLGLALPKAGGAVAGGTSTDPIRTDPTGTTTQPVSAATLPLPTGAATDATLGNVAKDATVSGVAKDGAAITGQALEAGGASVTGWLSSVRKAITDRLGALGQALMASSTPVVIASDQSAVASKNAAASQVDGHSAAIGATTDAATATTVIGRLQKLVALLAGGLPAALGRTTMAGSLSVALASDQANIQVQQQPSPLVVSGVGTANASFTTTVPAAGAGLFHYITAIEIIRLNPTATAVAGSAVLLSITTTNLPGSLAWSIGNALAAGAYDVPIRLMLNSPVKSSVANTATTIVCPAGGAGIQFRVNVYYYTGT